MKRCTKLKILNTFSVDVYAEKVIIINDEYSLLQLWKQSRDQDKFFLILGAGSNVLFLENYKGIVLLNRIKGIFVTENKVAWYLHVGAGEEWNTLVMYTIKRNMPGLENLVCIPGYVGAALIQNIGAYGVELSQMCEYVDVLDLNQGDKIRLYCHECCFRYRESIFKLNLYKYAILFVGLRINKHWKPVLSYSGLTHLNLNSITPRQIINTIIFLRYKKLPNPIIHGNVGSFFKNPVVDFKVVSFLLKKYSNIPYYFQEDGKVKLLAGWLIENCNLKGYILGEASVYYKQALVLINTRQKATGTEIAALALYVYNKVVDKFNIRLKPEVRLIGSFGEINPKKLFLK
ncbi:UDP-N-acetylenolpyruvoylglucosamine reductase [Candidatus Blochmanniella floridana]|uniref:UDP-N-acetylenolpyruvoylglucosamine reductase n=1 Tax=Blochmanniella floridana TaxID=203907 RepID=MURB_BLOFL|nr:RecName: Full=UDP-N-acetylenolpyruvoylglucosamine reductase; AltName: Full=UDP-N-acetylmuramate dehydrogenase [Candidatus Blochmannia floridanus]CAD83702.1 UDP-N-acetylenolpyruvoylglucosamine reductase [Candidatus Blochmannia floridanus]